jgi:hypothetical protein
MTIFYCGRRETAVDWEVKIADFVPSTAKPATRQVFCWGKMGKRFLMLRIELSACDKEGYGAEKGS